MAIFVSSNYPRRAPILFVCETSTVAVKPQHPHVGPNGMVYLPYLHSWNEATSSLVAAFDALLAVFQQKPFVYARPPAGSVPPASSAAMMQSVGGQMHLMQTQAAGYPPIPLSMASNVSGYAAANQPPPFQQQQHYPGYGYPPPPPPQANPGAWPNNLAVSGYGQPAPVGGIAGRSQQAYTSHAPPNPYTEPPQHPLAVRPPVPGPPPAAAPPVPAAMTSPPPPPPSASVNELNTGVQSLSLGPSSSAAATDEPPDEFVDNFFMCEIMQDPVFADDGYTYERASIVEWLQKHDTSPATGGKLESKRVVPNHALRGRIIAWKEARGLPTH